MRRTIKLSFKQLVSENKKELLKDQKEMTRIEKRIDDKYSK
ncbi:FbpB family small basic protein [Fictibacillus sp. Mic-4]|nr:FbpB family small basic protein [Fictibacillus gelatini]